jgi:predicted nucleic acid-binding protein
VIVVDTGAQIGLLDRSDPHHTALVELYKRAPDGWVLPWAILAEVDYLVASHLGEAAQAAWLADLAEGHFQVEWGTAADLQRAHQICTQYRRLRPGLVDGVVMAIAERLKADIATLDLRHFGVVAMAHAPKLWPRDLAQPPARRGRRRV